MKLIMTVQEAVERGVWAELMQLFGREAEDEVWPNEEFVLTEAQARKLGVWGDGGTSSTTRAAARTPWKPDGPRGDMPPGVDTGVEPGRPRRAAERSPPS